MVQVRVFLVSRDCVSAAQLLLRHLCSRVGALRIQGAEEETERCRVDRAQIVQLGLFRAEGGPVVVRVSLEAALLGNLSVVIKTLHRDHLEN